MPKALKQLLSICSLAFFIIIAIASAANKLSHIPYDATKNLEDTSETSGYLLKNDGTKVYGNKVKWQSGIILKDQVSIDGQKFKMSEIKEFSAGGYYARVKTDFVKRVIQGKINVYAYYISTTSTTFDSKGNMRMRTFIPEGQFLQKGEGNELVLVTDVATIKNAVADCPLALQMIDISNSKLKKNIKKDNSYLRKVIDVYNNNCKPLN